MGAGGYTLCRRPCVHLCTKLAGVYLVFIEMIRHLPVAIVVEFLSSYLIEVHIGHILLGGYLLKPFALRLAHRLALVIFGIARG